MKNSLVENSEPTCQQTCCTQFIYVAKLMVLVLGTYGLMIGMFALSLAIEFNGGAISKSYQAGGGIMLGLFILLCVSWGVAWCWGARKRQDLRKQIVDRQLALIRGVEQAEEEKDLEQERIMIEQRRRQQQSKR